MKLIKFIFVLFFAWHYQIFDDLKEAREFKKYCYYKDFVLKTSLVEIYPGRYLVGYLEDDEFKDLYEVYRWRNTR